MSALSEDFNLNPALKDGQKKLFSMQFGIKRVKRYTSVKSRLDIDSFQGFSWKFCIVNYHYHSWRTVWDAPGSTDSSVLFR